MPPRVPKGRPSMCSFCERSEGPTYVFWFGAAEVSPRASRLILDAAAKYASSSAEETLKELAMLSKPKLESSGGNNELTSTSTASRSRRSEEHTSELQSQSNLVCRLLL